MHNAAAFLRIKFAEGTSHDGRSLRATAPFPNMMPLRHQFMEFPQRDALWASPTYPHYGGR